MPRSIQVAASADMVDAILKRLDEIDGVVGITRQPNASLEPPGDVLTIQTTNDATKNIFSLLESIGVQHKGSLQTSQLMSLIGPGHEEQLERETNETTWDEMASLLRQDSNVDFNFLASMFLAGAVAAGGLWTDTLHLVIGAMIIAPAFEPLIRIPFGLVCHLPGVAWQGARASVLGYLMLIVGAATSTLVLRLIDPAAGDAPPPGHWIGYWSSFSAPGLLVSTFGALAGAIVVAGLRSVLTTGVMITLALIPAMSLVGMGLACGDLGLAGMGLARWAADAALVAMMGGLLFGLKQKFVHRRKALG